MVQKDASGNSTQSVIKISFYIKVKIGKVMATFVPRWLDFSSELTGPAADVSKILYGENRKLYGKPKRIVQ
jgi:hypothetical protein